MQADNPLESAERQRLLAQYAEIAALAGGLAHEIRNPLSTMSMNLELLEEDFGQGETSRDHRVHRRIQTLQRECRHLEDILNAFLQFVRVGECELALTDLNEVVKDFIQFFQPTAREQNVDISPHLADNLPAVQLDRSLFRQVLLNLALNALQAMPSGGLIEIQTYTRDSQVLVDMIDNGIGMDQRTQENMFQTFFSTKRGGSGLGLPTVRRIVEAHGGTMSCESALERGTRFTISLPISAGRSPETTAHPHASQPADDPESSETVDIQER